MKTHGSLSTSGTAKAKNNKEGKAVIVLPDTEANCYLAFGSPITPIHIFVFTSEPSASSQRHAIAVSVVSINLILFRPLAVGVATSLFYWNLIRLF